MASYTNIDNANHEIDRLREWVRWYEAQLRHSRNSLNGIKSIAETSIWNIKQAPRSWDRPSEEWIPAMDNFKATAERGLVWQEQAGGE